MGAIIATSTSITAPASEVPAFIPVTTAMQTLPFELLQWENFERLCYRLAGEDAEVESHSLYGRAGQAQQGIDIYARKRNGKYNSWQAKRYKKYTVADLKNATRAFLSGTWLNKTEVFCVAVQCAVDDVKLQNETESQAAIFRAKGIQFKLMGGHDLSSKLREHPAIVLEFFGRECAKHFYGDTLDNNVLCKLDGAEFHKIRAQLHRVYQAGFELLDRIPVDAPTPFSEKPQESISLLQRFSPPDVLVRESIVNHAPKTEIKNISQSLDQYSRVFETKAHSDAEDGRQSEQYRRTPLPSWLAEADKIAVIGNAGSGKSTVLRCLALDLLGDQQRFTDVAKKWGRHLPLFISFAKWVRLTEATVETAGIKDLLRASWQQQLTMDLVKLIDHAIDESRVILFVDGLDEWANEQAARTTLQNMLTIIAAHNIPVIVTARPRGLTRIGAIPDDWAVGMLAPLSAQQQRDIAIKWFSRNSGEKSKDPAHEDSVAWKANRFFKELHNGRGIAALAETPLLLLGLIALAVRRLVLPLNKVQALGQLTELLLEVHPTSRATAAGDVISRFSIAASMEVRREALGALAFKMRTEGGDAGYSLLKARQCIKQFLSDEEGYAYASEQALAVANEILAVNSETIGLLVEKGPQEVGFVHASLEEYLASVHIQGWPLEKILDFVRSNASVIRWRSVFGDLLAKTIRRSEADQIVAVIDEPECDAIGALQRRLLLADVAFGGVEINKNTALKLSKRSFDIITGAGWAGEKSAHLLSAFEGMYNATLGATVCANINHWAIRRGEYLTEFYEKVSNWAKSEHQLRILKHGLTDDSSSNRRTAARSLAVKYAGDLEVCSWLESLLRGDTDLEVVAVAIEALAFGWPESDLLMRAIQDASRASDDLLVLSAISCKIRLKFQKDEDLELLLNLLDSRDGINYAYKGWASQSLIDGWPNKKRIIKICLEAVIKRVGLHQGIEKTAAEAYLLSCPITNVDICNWILLELKSDNPFNSHTHRDWGSLLPFANANESIRNALIKFSTSKKAEHREYLFKPIYENINDARIKNHLINKARSSSDFSLFWALAPLVEGWAASDPDVIQLIQEVKSWGDEQKLHVISLFPSIMSRDECLVELSRLINGGLKLRTDIVLSAYHQLDVKSDEEIVNTLIGRFLLEPQTLFSGGRGLIPLFPQHPKVRELALNHLDAREPPLALLASVYGNDPQIQRLLAERTASLGTSLRQQIIESAANEYDRNQTSNDILQGFDLEVDGVLKIQAAIRNYQALYSIGAEREDIIDKLIQDAQAVGHDHAERRASAFAGLLIYKATDKLKPLQWANKPLDISLGSYERENQTLLRLTTENWNELYDIFGDSIFNRIKGISLGEPHIWDLFAPHVSSNALLKQQFIEHITLIESPIGLQSLRALAKDWPKSDLLRKHCCTILQLENFTKNHLSWHDYQSYFEAASILRDQFPDEEKITRHLEDIVKKSSYRHGITALALYDPSNKLLDRPANDILELIGSTGNFAMPVLLAANRVDSEKFHEVVKLTVNRSLHSIWDFQDRMNFAIKARIMNDEGFVSLIKSTLESNPTENEIASFSRFLVSTGRLDERTQQLFHSLLNERIAASGIPAHGYDALADAIRPVTHSLLDALAGPIS